MYADDSVCRKTAPDRPHSPHRPPILHFFRLMLLPGWTPQLAQTHSRPIAVNDLKPVKLSYYDYTGRYGVAQQSTTELRPTHKCGICVLLTLYYGGPLVPPTFFSDFGCCNFLYLVSATC